MNTTAIYFSATYTSKKGVESIAEVIDKNYTVEDITLWNAEPTRKDFARDELVVFGAPVYAGRLFKGASERFRKFKGNNTPCIITVTYGNRDYDDALLELFDLVKLQGFIPIAAAALIGEHTYGSIQLGRPNQADLEENRRFAQSVCHKLKEGNREEVKVSGNRPYKEGLERGGSFRPQTLNSCIKCGVCFRNCPQGAIERDYRGIKEDLCISCFRCIKNCPVQAKVVDTEEYKTFAEEFSKQLSTRKENLYIV